ncbi:MAG: glycosidase, partial [bacterium]
MGCFKLKRTQGPILSPLSENHWESRAVFNPATVRENGYIHLLYRAVEGHYFSTLGYAKLN